MFAQFVSIPHAASATLATTARTITSALHRRPGTLTAHYSRVQQALQRSAHTSCSISAPQAIPFSTFPATPLHRARLSRPKRTILLQRRHCSYQRNMGTDVVESHIDVSKGREVLPKNVKPLHYRITLEPNLETFEFDGQVDIE